MKEVEEWLKRAEKDLDDAKFSLEGKRFELASFLSQQAIEKALKTLYLKKFNKIKKIHDLVILGRSVNLPKKFIKECKEITAAYTYTRYPEIPRVKNIESSARRFVKQAEVIISWIKRQL
ncbi:MAG: HEPN domain-containing protein [Candidatus Aenigmarchaeota archaeon]|nr:HEPN domain-containing protein [Candidatus Aenigmarchaeota archaeon]